MYLRQKLFRCGQLCCTTSILSLNTEQQMQQEVPVSCFPLPLLPLEDGLLCLVLQAGRRETSPARSLLTRMSSGLRGMQNKPQLLHKASAFCT